MYTGLMNDMKLRKDDLLQLNDDSLRMYLLLTEIEEAGTRSKMTLKEASLRTGVPTQRVASALDLLGKQGIINHESGMTFNMTRDDGLNFTIQFVNSKKNEDSGWEELIAENKQLRRELEDIETGYSGLAEILPEAPAQVFRVAESVIQRGVKQVETFYLTELIVRFGTQRTIKALHDSKTAKQPLKAAYSMLRRGRMGKGKETNTSNPEPVEYQNLDNYDPWGGKNNDA